MMNSQNPANRTQYLIEVTADVRGEENPADCDVPEDLLLLIDRLAIDAHEQDEDQQVAMTS